MYANNIDVSRNKNYNVLVRSHASSFSRNLWGDEVIVSIKELEVLEGTFPSKQLKMLLGWAAIRQDQLMDNWELATQKQELFAIEPLR